MTMWEIIKEEWDKLTWFGRSTWFPFFAILIPIVGYMLLIIGYPIYLIEKLVDPIYNQLKKLKYLFYKH